MKALHDYSKYKHLKGVMGIYMFKNKITNKIYIGKSKNIYNRIKEHFRHSLRDTNHTKYHFYNDLKKYEYDDWIIQCIEQIEDEDILGDRELYYINLYNSVEEGYNCSCSTDGGHLYGDSNPNSIISDEDIYKIRELYKTDITAREAFKQFDNISSLKTFEGIWRGYTRKNIHMDVYTEENKLKRLNNRKRKNEDRFSNYDDIAKYVTEIRLLYAEGKLSHSQVYEKFDFLNIHTFDDIWYGRTFKEIMPEEYVIAKKNGRKYKRIGNNKQKGTK